MHRGEVLAHELGDGILRQQGRPAEHDHVGLLGRQVPDGLDRHPQPVRWAALELVLLERLLAGRQRSGRHSGRALLGLDHRVPHQALALVVGVHPGRGEDERAPGGLSPSKAGRRRKTVTQLSQATSSASATDTTRR